MNAMMKALVCSSPHHLTLEDQRRPERSAGQITVKVARIGICGTDYHIYEGLHPFLEYPRVMGHELSGIVEETDTASKFKPGQLVVINPYLACGKCHACVNGKSNCCMKLQVLGVHCDGGMCEYLVLPEGNIIAADGLSADAAASVEFLAIGAHAVRRSAMASGTRVLVVGAGPIGLGAAFFAHIAGGHVTIMDRDEGRLALASKVTGIGSTLVANDGSLEEVFKMTNGNGFDVVFDATGNRGSMEKSFQFVCHGGRYVLVGVMKDPITFSDPDFHKRELTLYASRNATSQDFEHVMASIKSGKIPIDKLVTHRTSLSKVAEMLPLWAKDKNGLIKAMIGFD